MIEGCRQFGHMLGLRSADLDWRLTPGPLESCPTRLIRSGQTYSQLADSALKITAELVYGILSDSCASIWGGFVADIPLACRCTQHRSAIFAEHALRLSTSCMHQ